MALVIAGILVLKGIVFTQFIDMVEQRFSPDLADRIIVQADLPSGGAYTSVGTYDHAEIVKLVGELSKETGHSLPDLVKAFGSFLFQRFTELYPHFFAEKTSTFDFLDSVEHYIHVEVRKLYPDAELPSLTCSRDDQAMTMVYRSKRNMADLAEGLLLGCIEHFGEPVSLERQAMPEDGATVFTLQRQH
jgi:hypothetical protein